ncbi:MAG: FAD-binding protein [Pseudomonadota bacterium]
MANLVVAEHDNSILSPATLHTVTAAQEIGGPIHILVAGKGCGDVASAAASIAGVEKVLHADGDSLTDQLAENLAPIIAALSGGYSHILAPATTFGKDAMPRAAALIDAQQVSDIIAVESPDTFQRPIYAGNAIATVQSSDPIKVITVRTTTFEAAAADGGSAPIEAVDAGNAADKVRFVKQELSDSERPELAGAKIVVSGGRGLGSAENFQMLERVADKLGAAIGASRAAVDAGYVPNDYQVGQTGKVVAPDLYIAVGISGAIQHLAGMKDSKVIVAINKDENAPIFSVADYGLVADLFEAVPALEEALD